MITCPTCGSSDCIRSSAEVLSQAPSLYAPCRICVADTPLDKLAPLRSMGCSFTAETGRCPSCGRRHIDMVMAQVLGLLIDLGLKSEAAALKDVGTPLIASGVELAGPPRLGRKELILVLDDVDPAAAKRIIAAVPEVKGVIRRRGGPKKSVGLMDTGQDPHLYELLAGCDVRTDVINSMLGDFCFYRRQAVMHIEFWRNNSVKIKMIEQLFLNGDLEGRIIVDGMASTGTLGLMAAAGGAKKVILNDAWLPAVESMLLNIKTNSELLGVRLEHVRPLSGLPMVGDEPVLVAKASGNVELEVYHGDFRKLPDAVKSCDVCIIDPFPGMPADEFVQLWQGITKGRIITL